MLTDDNETERNSNLDFALVCFVSKHDFYSEKCRKNIDRWVRYNKAVPRISEVVRFLFVNNILWCDVLQEYAVLCGIMELDKCVPTYLKKYADGACHLWTSELDIKSRQVSEMEC